MNLVNLRSAVGELRFIFAVWLIVDAISILASLLALIVPSMVNIEVPFSLAAPYDPPCSFSSPPVPSVHPLSMFIVMELLLATCIKPSKASVSSVPLMMIFENSVPSAFQVKALMDPFPDVPSKSILPVPTCVIVSGVACAEVPIDPLLFSATASSRCSVTRPCPLSLAVCFDVGVSVNSDDSAFV